MNTTQQGVYASNLRQNVGYPLRSPGPSEPGDTVGLRIGDVGHVDQYGEFKVLRNICVPPSHYIPSVEKATDTKHLAISHDAFFATGVKRVMNDPSLKDGYEFIANSDAGAILILPSGATRYELQNQRKMEKFRDLAAEHAVSWCKSAGQDSLYLITGLYKTHTWTLGSFYGRQREDGEDIHIRLSGKESANPAAYEWSTTYPTDRESSLKDDSYENQTVLIKGFKMTVRPKAPIVLERVEGWQSAWIAYILWFFGYLAWAAWRLGVPLDWIAIFTSVKYYPALSQPPHYSDLINRYLLEKNSEAEVAITHDDVWIKMLEESRTDIMEESTLLENLERDYICQPDNKAVYLRSRTEDPNSPHRKSESLVSQPAPAVDDVQIVITHMRAENVTDGLGRVPVGFFVRVEVDGRPAMQTKNKAAQVYDPVIWWDDRIHMPFNPSTEVRLVVCASFELLPMLGRGEPLGTLKTRVCDLLDRSSAFMASEMEDVISPSLSLLISVQKWHCNNWMSGQVNGSADRDKGSIPTEITESTDEGQRVLLRYQKDRNPEDLKTAIHHFGHAVEKCPADHPCRAAVLFNLARAEFLTYQSDGTPLAFDNAISHYQAALDLRPRNHPDRPMTLLHIAQAYLYQYSASEHEASVETKLHDLVDELKRSCAEGTHVRRAAELVLQTYRRIRLQDSDDVAELDQLISDLDTAAHELPETYFDKPVRFNNLGLALNRRFQLRRETKDLNQAIEWFEKTVNVAPKSHPDRPNYLSHLGDALLVRFQQQHAVPLTRQL